MKRLGPSEQYNFFYFSQKKKKEPRDKTLPLTNKNNI